LAGGYSQECWRYTARFLSHLELGHALEPPTTEELTIRRYRYLATFFTTEELTGSDASNPFGITEADLALPGWAGQQETRFLGFYTRHGLELALERFGFLDRLRDLGYPHPTLELMLEGAAGDTARIFGEPEKETLLVELRLGRDRHSVQGFELLSVEWLLMQNPRAEPAMSRPLLPGQSYPGLRLLTDVIALLIVVCDRLHLDGLVFVPSRFHIAAYGRSHLSFVDAEIQARFRAMLGFFADRPFAEAAAAVDQGRLEDADTGEPIRWQPAPMVLAVSERLDELVEERLRQAEAVETPRFRLRPEAGAA
ncbi:MAG: hypothetical protein MI919_01140, partial [Holophagales bacterium]|nr:hypothetical protein [Holophagales bacterium]